MNILLLFISSLCFKPNAQENPVLTPIRMLFQGMEQADSTLTRRAFIANPMMYTVLEKESGTELSTGDFQRFLNFIGSPREQVVAEPIWDIKIEQDGDFAQVWASYALYVGGSVNHCGVDAFQLVKLKGEWKIYAITDTRHKENCNVPEEIRRKYGK